MKVALFVTLSMVTAVNGSAQGDKQSWVTYGLNLQLWDTQVIDGQNVSIVRRAENFFNFRLQPGLQASLMFDFAKPLTLGKDHSYLQDAYLQWNAGPNWTCKIGQMKIPFSEEGTRSSAHLDTVERAQFDLGSNRFADLRELGAMAQFQNSHLLAQFGAFNGNPTNQSVGAAVNEGVGRLVFSPDRHFSFGGSLSRGSRHNVDPPLNASELNDKNGIEFTFNDRAWLFETEYVSGRLDLPVAQAGILTGVAPTTREGWYAKLRYDINSNWQVIVREDELVTNVQRPSNGERDITGGFTTWLQKRPQEVFFQLNYVNRRSFSPTPVPSIWRARVELFF